jgi:hypothetical protein
LDERSQRRPPCALAQPRRGDGHACGHRVLLDRCPDDGVYTVTSARAADANGEAVATPIELDGATTTVMGDELVIAYDVDGAEVRVTYELAEP